MVPVPLATVPEETYVGIDASCLDETDTIATFSLPDPTVWSQLRLLAPASAVWALEIASKAIGNVPAGLAILVRSISIALRYRKGAGSGASVVCVAFVGEVPLTPPLSNVTS